MKKLFFVLALSFLGAISPVSAQKIAYVDINKILDSMDEYRRANEELEKTATTWRQQIAQEYDKIKGMYNKYQAEQVLLSDEVRKQREDEIMVKEKEVRDLQKDKFGPDGALFKKRQEMVRPIQDKVYAAIENYANNRGYDMILDKGGAVGIIYASSKFDVTSDILKSINR